MHNFVSSRFYAEKFFVKKKVLISTVITHEQIFLYAFNHYFPKQLLKETDVIPVYYRPGTTDDHALPVLMAFIFTTIPNVACMFCRLNI